jgi:hypothetical protein
MLPILVIPYARFSWDETEENIVLDHDGPVFELYLEHIRKVEEYKNPETGLTESFYMYLVTQCVEDAQGESHDLGFQCACEHGVLEIRLDTNLVSSSDRWFKTIDSQWLMSVVRTYYQGNPSRILWNTFQD